MVQQDRTLIANDVEDAPVGLKIGMVDRVVGRAGGLERAGQPEANLRLPAYRR